MECKKGYYITVDFIGLMGGKCPDAVALTHLVEAEHHGVTGSVHAETKPPDVDALLVVPLRQLQGEQGDLGGNGVTQKLMIQRSHASEARHSKYEQLATVLELSQLILETI